MANVEHTDITDPFLHEPKGITSANLGDILVAHGANIAGDWGTWQQPGFAGLIIVDEASDFPDPVSDVITLDAGIIYIIAGDVNLVDARIVYTAGANIVGFNRESSVLRTNAPGLPLLSSVSIHFQVAGIKLVNPAGSLIAVNGSNAFSAIVDTILIGNCSTIGTFTNCSSVVMDRVAVLDTVTATNSIQFTGTFLELFVRHCYFRNWIGNLFDFVTDSPVFEIMAFIGTRFFGTPALIAINGLTGSANVNNLGVLMASIFDDMINPVNGIAKGDDNWIFSSCAGVQNSIIQGFVSMVGNVTETTINVTGTFEKIAGTTISSASNERFIDNSMDNQLEFTGDRPSQVIITASASTLRIGTGNPDAHSLTIFKNSSQLDPNAVSTTTSGGEIQFLSMTVVDTATAGDIYEAYIANDSDADNVLVVSLQLTIKG